MRRNFWWLVAGIVLAGCTDQPSVSGPSEAGPAPLLSARGPKGPSARYIVVFRPGITNVDALAYYLTNTFGGQIHHRYRYALQGFSASLPAQALDGIRHNPLVEYVEADQAFITDGGGVQSGAPWGLDRIDQRSSLDGNYTYAATGNGVTAYIIDTGIRYSHADFGGRASFGFDAFGGDGSDCQGHGTHTAGTVGGTTYGVAKAVKLVSVRVLGCTGGGSSATVLAGLDWLAANAARPAVANLSLGGGADNAVDDAVRHLISVGVAVAVSAGNKAMSACFFSPARVSEAMTVGATDSTDAAASFTNYGDCVDWYAPGVSVLSAGYGGDQATAMKSGTSMAAPHTAGVAALYLERYPTATPAQVSSAIAEVTTKRAVGFSGSTKGDLLYATGLMSAPSNTPPTAAFAATCNGPVCNFADQSLDNDGSIASRLWSFGDNTTSTDQSPSHTFAAGGTYHVTLTVQDNSGATGSVSKDISVAVAPVSNLPPSVEFAANCSRLDCDFTDSSHDPDGAIAKWVWNFGDGASSINVASTGQSHVFTAGGMYQVSLTVTDDAGASTTTVKDLAVGVVLMVDGYKVKGKPEADLTWTGAESASVSIYLNGALLTTVTNSGSYSYKPSGRGQSTYSFRVCETGISGPICSLEQKVTM